MQALNDLAASYEKMLKEAEGGVEDDQRKVLDAVMKLHEQSNDLAARTSNIQHMMVTKPDLQELRERYFHLVNNTEVLEQRVVTAEDQNNQLRSENEILQRENTSLRQQLEQSQRQLQADATPLKLDIAFCQLLLTRYSCLLFILETI